MNRAVALEALRTTNDVLSALGARFWLDCGSLLGAVRHGDIMEHDLDVDFSSWDWERHEEIAEAMVAAGFKLLRTHGTPESGYEQRFGWHNVKLDIFYFYEGTVHGPEEGTCWQGSWDYDRLIESRFPTDIARETVPFSFKDITVPVPIEFEAMLVARYDDWTEIVPKWDWRTDPSCIVSDPLEDVTFLLKSFMRPKTTLRAVRSVRETYPAAEVLVVDDSDQPAAFKDELEAEGARLLRLPYDSGLSAGRNAGLKEITTRYVCVMDDDMVVSSSTRLQAMLELLEDADIVCGSMKQAGRIINWEGTYEFTEDGGLRLVQYAGDYETTGESRWAPVEFGLNCMVSTTEFLRAHPWDETLKLHEHTDFFLRLRGEAKVVFTPDSIFDHSPERTPTYRKMRYRKEFRLLFFHKHGIRYHIGISGHRDNWTPRDEAALKRLLAGEPSEVPRTRRQGGTMANRFHTVEERTYLDRDGRATLDSKGATRLFAIPGQKITIEEARAVGLLEDPVPPKAQSRPQAGAVIPGESRRAKTTAKKTTRKRTAAKKTTRKSTKKRGA